MLLLFASEALQQQHYRGTGRQLEKRDMMWIYAAVIILVSEAWTLDPGTNRSTSVNSSTSSDTITIDVIQNLTFNLGSDVNLTLSDKTWNETMYVIWEIQLKERKCKIAFNNDGRNENSCNDGKSLQNTSRSQSYLRIPSFSTADVGIYKCELVYNGGNKNYVINMAITVPPRPSAWLESTDKGKVAVCKAEGGKPAANISWNHIESSPSVETLLSSDGLITVESRLELTEAVDTKNLTCTIRHLYWERARILVPKHKEGDFLWRPIHIVIVIVVVIVFLVGFLFFAQKKLIILRQCQQSDTSLPKFPQTEDVEEVEPYASYVQRVNSIYN